MKLLKFCILIIIILLHCHLVFNIVEKIKYIYCQFTECCNEDYIKADIRGLETVLKYKLYGQHIALDTVVHALQGHFADKQPEKPLTLSFHGWPGSGKNYLAEFIKDAIYKKGAKSKYVHHFMGRVHFPLESKADEYKVNLQNWIKGNVTNCARSLFIFDEVDKMPASVLNAIKPMIDYHAAVDGVDYRRAIFIFLSNTGSSLINDYMVRIWTRSIKREDVELKNFEKMIANGSFNEKGGFHHSETIQNHVIDYYVPFLPMERVHVELCIKDQFRKRGVYEPDQTYIDEVMDDMIWQPIPEKIFSTSGCKRITSKVVSIIGRHKKIKGETNEL